MFQVIFSRGPWLDLQTYQKDPLLRAAVQRIPGIVKSARSKNTNKKYDYYFLGFAKWCREHGFDFLPAKDSTVFIFLSDLSSKDYGSSALSSFFLQH